MHSENYFFASCSKEKKKRKENKEREKRKREKKKERESQMCLTDLSKNNIDSIGNREYLLLSKCIVRFQLATFAKKWKEKKKKESMDK